MGYQIEGAQLIRIDSQYLHAEVVKPALALLNAPGFEGVQQEFLSAHRHYRKGEHRQAVSMAASALESTFKAIFDQKDWEYGRGDTLAPLMKVANRNGLWPDYLDGGFDQLVAALKNGLPKIRDNVAAHGQGAEVREVPDFIAAYALHSAASAIVFLVGAAAER